VELDELVLSEGDRVAASGRLVRNQDGDWFEPPPEWVAFSEVRHAVRSPWRGSVRVMGADFDALVHRFEHAGEIEGLAAVRGVWSGESVHVESQGPPKSKQRVFESWVTPPCSPPEGGWPEVVRRGDITFDYELRDLEETGQIVAQTIFQPAENRPVLVVAAADVHAVEAILRPQLGDSLCVVPSRWTKDQLEAIRGDLEENSDRWSLREMGPRHLEDGQVRLRASLTRILPEIAEWAAPLPEGILDLDPWLRPSERLAAGEAGSP
jgi:hypothetical protein